MLRIAIAALVLLSPNNVVTAWGGLSTVVAQSAPPPPQSPVPPRPRRDCEDDPVTS
jgi:hypothetical protein